MILGASEMQSTFIAEASCWRRNGSQCSRLALRRRAKAQHAFWPRQGAPGLGRSCKSMGSCLPCGRPLGRHAISSDDYHMCGRHRAQWFWLNLCRGAKAQHASRAWARGAWLWGRRASSAATAVWAAACNAAALRPPAVWGPSTAASHDAQLCVNRATWIW